jgi:hypothetical protein
MVTRPIRPRICQREDFYETIAERFAIYWARICAAQLRRRVADFLGLAVSDAAEWASGEVLDSAEEPSFGL